MDLEKFDRLPVNEKMTNPRNRRRKQGSRSTAKEKEEHRPSELENEVASYLAIIGVDYVREKTFPDLESAYGSSLLPLDFWLPQHRSVIEVDGTHHRRRVKGDKTHSLDVRKLNDQLRNLFCLQRGFKLLRLRSDRMENFKETIDKFLNNGQ